MKLQWEVQHLQLQQEFICRLIAVYTARHPPKVWEQFVDDLYSILKCMHFENRFHHINNPHQNIKFTMEEESNGELAFLDTLLKPNKGEISVLAYVQEA